MAKTHRKRASRRSSRHSSRRYQRGGAGFGYSAPAGVAAGGVPFENRISYEVCSDSRVAPVLGDLKQFGGGCCGVASPPYGGQRGGRYRSQSGGRYRSQSGGGSGTGGYGFVLNNDMGKMYADVRPGPCPSSQTGGGEAIPMSSYSAGYGFGNPYSTPNGSAHFFEQQAYAAKTCMGGGARRKAKDSRKAKGSRKAHRKAAKKSRKQRKH
jgi:hypothetical protein